MRKMSKDSRLLSQTMSEESSHRISQTAAYGLINTSIGKSRVPRNPNFDTFKELVTTLDGPFQLHPFTRTQNKLAWHKPSAYARAPIPAIAFVFLSLLYFSFPVLPLTPHCLRSFFLWAQDIHFSTFIMLKTSVYLQTYKKIYAADIFLNCSDLKAVKLSLRESLIKNMQC